MRELLTICGMTLGSAFCFLAALGLVRMPDLYTRMQAATKSTTLGVGFILLAAAVYFGRLGIATQAILVIVFLLATAPIAAHAIGRAAYLAEIPKWQGTVLDEWEENPLTPPQAADDQLEG